MMNRRTSSLIIGFSLLVLTIVGLLSSGAEPTRGALPRNQNQDRIVRDMQNKDCPVRIRLIKTKKRAITMNREFSDQDDWLQGLSLRAVNRSNKTVTYIGVRLMFYKTKDQTPGMPASFPLDHGLDPLWLKPTDPIPLPTIEPIAPGGESDILLSDALHDELKTFLAQTGFFPNHKRLDVDITVVGFSDDTMWNLGNWLKRDPTQLKKPLPGWRLLDDALRESRGPKKTKGSASDRTAFLCWPVFARAREQVCLRARCWRRNKASAETTLWRRSVAEIPRALGSSVVTPNTSGLHPVMLTTKSYSVLHHVGEFTTG